MPHQEMIPATVTAAPANRRLKLWEVPHQFRCSIIGTCVSLDTLRRFARKAKMDCPGTATDYALHIAFVSAAGRTGYAARLLNKHLNQKYRSVLQRFSAADDGTVGKLWDEAVESGEVAGAFWALVTQPTLPEGLLERAYGDIHMMSHLSGASCRVDMRELAELRARTRELETQLATTSAATVRKIAQRDACIRALDSRLEQARETGRRLEAVEARLRTYDDGEVVRRLNGQVEDYAALLAEVRARAERAETDARKWRETALRHETQVRLERERTADILSERDALEVALEHALPDDCADCENRDGCNRDADLCGRCILYVGGRGRQSAHFRALVERQNGRFIHHDGGLHDGRQRLGSILIQADAVLCPVDCVSHDAASRVKDFCKRHGKELVFLPRSSLAAFTHGLRRLAA